MENKENVCEEISTAGQMEEEKSPLGKFKDVNALMQAYNSLQAEFTRRSQRLKELERAGKSNDGQTKSCKDCEEENLGDTAQNEGWQSASVKEPDTKAPYNGQPRKEVADEAQGVREEDAVAESGEKNLDGQAKPMTTAEDVYLLASKDEKVRLQIIGDYLQSLQDAGAPISKGGVGALLTPPKKAKTLDDAGNMALRLFKANNNDF